MIGRYSILRVMSSPKLRPVVHHPGSGKPQCFIQISGKARDCRQIGPSNASFNLHARRHNQAGPRWLANPSTARQGSTHLVGSYPSLLAPSLMPTLTTSFLGGVQEAFDLTCGQSVLTTHYFDSTRCQKPTLRLGWPTFLLLE